MKDFSHRRPDLKLSEQQAELARLAAPNCPGETHETTLFSVLFSVCFGDLIVIGAEPACHSLK